MLQWSWPFKLQQDTSQEFKNHDFSCILLAYHTGSVLKIRGFKRPQFLSYINLLTYLANVS